MEPVSQHTSSDDDCVPCSVPEVEKESQDSSKDEEPTGSTPTFFNNQEQDPEIQVLQKINDVFEHGIYKVHVDIDAAGFPSLHKFQTIEQGLGYVLECHNAGLRTNFHAHIAESFRSRVLDLYHVPSMSDLIRGFLAPPEVIEFENKEEALRRWNDTYPRSLVPPSAYVVNLVDTLCKEDLQTVQEKFNFSGFQDAALEFESTVMSNLCGYVDIFFLSTAFPSSTMVKLGEELVQAIFQKFLVVYCGDNEDLEHFLSAGHIPQGTLELHENDKYEISWATNFSFLSVRHSVAITSTSSESDKKAIIDLPLKNIFFENVCVLQNLVFQTDHADLNTPVLVVIDLKDKYRIKDRVDKISIVKDVTFNRIGLDVRSMKYFEASHVSICNQKIGFHILHVGSVKIEHCTIYECEIALRMHGACDIEALNLTLRDNKIAFDGLVLYITFFDTRDVTFLSTVTVQQTSCPRFQCEGL